MPKDELVPKKQDYLSSSVVEQGMSFAEFHIFRQYMHDLSLFQVEKMPVLYDEFGNKIDEYSNMRFFRITQIVLDKEENSIDKLASIYGAVHSINATLMLVIKSTTDGIEFYIGVKSDPDSKIAASMAGLVLKSAFSSNFSGSKLEDLKIPQTTKLLNEILVSKDKLNVSSVAINPSLRDDDKDHFVQGLEKLMDAFSGEDYMACFIAEPQGELSVEASKRGYEELYSLLSHFSESTLSYSSSESKTITDNISSSFSDGINSSIAKSNGGSRSFGASSGHNRGSSSGGTGFFGGNWSNQSGSSYTETDTSGTNWSENVTQGSSKTNVDQHGQSRGTTTGETTNLSVKHTNKSVARMLEKIDELLDKIGTFESFGMWGTSAYFLSPNIQTSIAVANTFRALVLGEETRTEAFINTWGTDNVNTSELCNYISVGRHPLINLPQMSQQYMSPSIKPTSLVSGKELPIFLGLPRNSLKGLIVNTMASFGRTVSNLDPDETKRAILLGSVLHKGVEDDNNPVMLDIDKFTSHCFITGSTGSGKSTTTCHIIKSLVQQKINFLVIEPKKGEYKIDFGNLPGVNIFWTSKEYYSFLRINPFSFPKNIHVLEHMDRMIEIFSACWPLHNAMPAILKSSIERIYIECGWDLSNSRYFDIDKPKFPTFNDLLAQLPKVIDESDYSAQAKGDYKGALVTRVSSLTNGIMGEVFTSGVELEDSVLFDENTIVDLSRVGASETKSLIMGILVMKLNEHRISNATKTNVPLHHVTIIEEAHNLLRRVSMEQSSDNANLAGKSVEMISNSIAEMRTYGEGFIIVDQSPTTVDQSAMKNTNTKIVMRLQDQTDIDLVASSFSLDEDQTAEIASLPKGVAIVGQSGWVEPVMVKVKPENIIVYNSNKKGEPALKKIAPSECFYKKEELPQKNDGKSVLLQFINTVFGQADRNNFNEDKVRSLLKRNQVSDALCEELIRTYQNFCVMPEALRDNQNTRASFVIRVVGCNTLLDVFSFAVGKDATNGQIYSTYKLWKQKIFSALNEYAQFNDDSEKFYILKQIVIVKANVEKNAVYQRLLKVLKNPPKGGC